jgi:hypothetical protein
MSKSSSPAPHSTAAGKIGREKVADCSLTSFSVSSSIKVLEQGCFKEFFSLAVRLATDSTRGVPFLHVSGMQLLQRKYRVLFKWHCFSMIRVRGNIESLSNGTEYINLADLLPDAMERVRTI